jgi:hypothetical protein
MTNFKYKFNCLIKVISIFFLYFDFATDLYLLYLIRNYNYIFSISFASITIPYCIYWSSNYNFRIMSEFMQNNKIKPFFVYLYSFPFFGLIYIILFDFIENFYLFFFNLKQIFKTEKIIIKKYDYEDRLRYRTILFNIYESIPQVVLQLYIYQNIEAYEINSSVTIYDIYRCLVISIVDLAFNIYMIYSNSKKYGCSFLKYLFYFIASEKDILQEIGFGLEKYKKRFDSNFNYYLKNGNINYKLKYTRFQINHCNIISIKKNLNYIESKIAFIKFNYNNKNMIKQKLLLKLPYKFSTTCLPLDIIDFTLFIRNKRYTLNYDFNFVIKSLFKFELIDEFLYLLTYNNSNYYNYNINDNKIEQSLEKYIKCYMKFLTLPSLYLRRLDMCEVTIFKYRKDNYNYKIVNNFYDQINNLKQNIDKFLFDYDIHQNLEQNQDKYDYSLSLYLLHIVTYHCPISMIYHHIENLESKLDGNFINENSISQIDSKEESNNYYYEKKFFEKINKLFISNIKDFNSYKQYENLHLFNKNINFKKKVNIYYDINNNGMFELGELYSNNIENIYIKYNHN